jgi:hypothetical protein
VSLGKLQEFNGGVKAFLTKLDDMPVFQLTVMPRHVEMVESFLTVF